MLCHDADLARALLDPDDDHDDTTIVIDRAEQDDVLDHVLPTDLVVAPAHVVHDMPPWRARRLARRLHDANVAVVGGPHRLTISQGVTARPLSTSMGQPIVTT